jgi:chromosome segregation ATPase
VIGFVQMLSIISALNKRIGLKFKLKKINKVQALAEMSLKGCKNQLGEQLLDESSEDQASQEQKKMLDLRAQMKEQENTLQQEDSSLKEKKEGHCRIGKDFQSRVIEKEKNLKQKRDLVHKVNRELNSLKAQLTKIEVALAKNKKRRVRVDGLKTWVPLHFLSEERSRLRINREKIQQEIVEKPKVFFALKVEYKQASRELQQTKRHWEKTKQEGLKEIREKEQQLGLFQKKLGSRKRTLREFYEGLANSAGNLESLSDESKGLYKNLQAEKEKNETLKVQKDELGKELEALKGTRRLGLVFYAVLFSLLVCIAVIMIGSLYFW